jgi:GT2 family glycosyltransferase
VGRDQSWGSGGHLMPDLPPLHVVIVAYGSPLLLERCLGTLGDGLEVVIVDNSSSEEVSALADRHSCRYLDAGANIGFAAGTNRALAELGPNHGDVLLLNPDARIGGEVVRQLQKELRLPGHDRVACASPALYGDDGVPERVEWPFPSPLRAWIEALGLGSLGAQCGFLIGAGLLLRREAIVSLGGFDERYFLYAEETDWQWRATCAGWSVLFCSGLSGAHTGAGTSTDSDHREALFHASVERYIRKWHGDFRWRVFQMGVLFGAGARVVIGPHRSLNWERFLRYLHGPLRRGTHL